MTVVTNGRSVETRRGSTVADLIRAHGLDPTFVIVERNGEPLERARYEHTALGEGDRIELVRAVAGG